MTCDHEIENMVARIVGSPPMPNTTSRLNSNAWTIRITSPSWEPMAPVLVDIESDDSGKPVTCSFKKR